MAVDVGVTTKRPPMLAAAETSLATRSTASASGSPGPSSEHWATSPSGLTTVTSHQDWRVDTRGRRGGSGDLIGDGLASTDELGPMS